MEPCQECNGKGECERQRSLAVDIPPGVAQGRRLVLRGQGAPGQNGGKNGDLFVEVDIQAHPLLSRDGADLHCHVPIRVSEAVLGATIEVPLLDGSSLRVKVPMNTPNGQVLRLRNRGVPISKDRRGDLLIHVELETPAIETDAIALMEQLDTASQHPRRNHYDKVLRKCVE